MNVLVTYFSQSGNTEKIAKAIYRCALRNNNAELKKLEDITPDEVLVYDFIFIGSPLHAGSLAAPIKECLTVLQPGSHQKMAGFITHMAPAYPEQDMAAFAEPIKTACTKKGIEYKGCFDCQGFLAESMHGAVQKKLNMNDEQWQEMVTQMTGHPDEEDERKAEAFAESVLV